MSDLISRQAALDIVFDFAETPHRMYQQIRELPTIATVSTDDHVYRAGYTQAIKDIIEYMDNSDVLVDYVDPYEIGGFMLCLKNVGDTLIKELSD